MHKLQQGPREYKFRDRYEVVRHDEIPPYLRDYPDCMIGFAGRLHRRIARTL